MTRLVNRPADFSDEALRGFVAAEPERVSAVPGGVVRATTDAPGQVAIVLGGGSGHFPAFAGWVGPGLGHGAACGNIFASPSEKQVLAVARAASNGGGIIFAPINYAGDILHFGSALQTLRAEGVDARMVALTDDIASGTAEHREARRGIAGAFIAVKIAGAAAQRGDSIEQVERVLAAANDSTRSFGVAFSGCTLPGDAAPLFTVPAGRVALGLGIHGEPGIGEVPLGSAASTADLIVDALFSERAPQEGGRVAVLVNGLGSTKYDELFIIFEQVAQRLRAAGMTVVAPVVGELVTSLDMAGVSVSLCYLDQESEELWLAPADTYAFTRGASRGGEKRSAGADLTDDVEWEEGDRASRGAAEEVIRFLGAARDVLERAAPELGRLDAVAGDGDHGAGMLRGVSAALAAARDAAGHGGGVGTVLRSAGEAWSDVGGGTSGALWGTGLAAAGDTLGDRGRPNEESIVAAVQAFTTAIADRGGAVRGDKTMLDATIPFAEALVLSRGAGGDLAEAWIDASAVATASAEATADHASRRGRSRLHGDRSLGTPDPGATSFALVVQSIGAVARRAS